VSPKLVQKAARDVLATIDEFSFVTDHSPPVKALRGALGAPACSEGTDAPAALVAGSCEPGERETPIHERNPMECFRLMFGQCPTCGGKMIGDGATEPVRCESVDTPLDRECDAAPLHCERVDESAE
jgi:hypothetical protein